MLGLARNAAYCKEMVQIYIQQVTAYLDVDLRVKNLMKFVMMNIYRSYALVLKNYISRMLYN